MSVTDRVKVIVEGEDRASGPLGKAFGAIQNLGKTAMTMATAVVAGTVAAGAGMIKLAADAEGYIAVETSFVSLTKRMGVGSDEFLESMTRATNGLVTNRDLMKTVNTAASLIGEDFAQTLPDAMGLLRNASKATGEDLGFLLDSYTKGIGRLSPQILDNLGVQASLTEAQEMAAQMFSKGTDELTKQEEQLGMNAVVLGKLGEAYGDIPDAGRVFGKFPVMLKNLKDEVGVLLWDALSPMAEKFAGLATDLIPKLVGIFESKVLPVVTAVTDIFSGLFFKISEGTPPLELLGWMIDTVAEALGLGGEGAYSLGGAFLDLVGKVQDLAARVGELLAPVLEWAQANVTTKDVLIALGIAIATVVVPAVLSILAPFLLVIAAGAALILGVTLVRKAWESNWMGIRDKVKAVIGFIVPFATNAIARVKTWWADNGEAILAKAKAIWDSIKGAIRLVMELIQAIISGVWGVIKAIWDAYGQEILAMAKGVWEAIKSAIDTIFNAIKGLLTGFVALFKGDWEGFGEAISQTWTTIWNGIKDIVGALWAGVKPLLTKLWTNFLAWFNEMDWYALGEKITTGIKDALGKAWTAVKGTMEAFWSDLKAWFTSIDWADLGKKILDGILSALTGLGGAIRSLISGVAAGLGITIPGFQAGTVWAPPGMAWVGERGPELIYLPAGATVYNASSSAQLAGRGGGAEIHHHYELHATYEAPRRTSPAQDLRAMELLRSGT